MTLARLLYIFGFLLLVYAIISGLNLHYSVNDEGSTFESDYTFKIGTFIFGVILIFLGRNSQKA